MNLKNLIGKDAMTCKIFTGKDTFEAVDAAEGWLKAHGYSIASMASSDPIGVRRGDWLIAKWYNLDEGDRRLLDGVIVEGDINVDYFMARWSAELPPWTCHGNSRNCGGT